MLLNQVCAIVDLETTGTNANSERITEVGALLIDVDHSEYSFQQLLNPGISIPPYVASLTGIHNEMVADQPGFEDIATELWGLLNDCVFIAHNARFDYSFLKRAFKHCGYSFRPKIICTLKLARALFPHWQRYSLAAIMEQINGSAGVRHRAMADVLATREFLDYAIAEHGLARVNACAQQQLGKPSLPTHLDAGVPDSLPDSPGVYYFFGEQGQLLYVGKSKTIRTRVKSHFSADVREPREMRMAQEVHSIDYRTTAGELGALLMENLEIKQRQPIYNRRLRPLKKLWCIFLQHQQTLNTLQVKQLDATQSFPAVSYGVYSSRNATNKHLRKLAEEHGLCKKVMGLEHGKGACFAYQLGKCNGVCIGKEDPSLHNERLLDALQQTRIEAWPFAGDVLICEHNTSLGITDAHRVSNWAYLGSWRWEGLVTQGELIASLDNVESMDSAQRLACNDQPGFDKDGYRLLYRALVEKVFDGLSVVPLNPTTEETAN